MNLFRKIKDTADKVKQHADTNNDGKIDAKDLQSIKKIVDKNNDRKVNKDDFTALKNSFRKK